MTPRRFAPGVRPACAFSRLLGPLLARSPPSPPATAAAERAEAHYERGLAYLAAGDPERAVGRVPQRPPADPDHAEARLRYAGLLRDRGDAREALAQYLRLVEQAPDLAAATASLAALALETQDFETATAACRPGLRARSRRPGGRALKATVDFRGRQRPAGGGGHGRRACSPRRPATCWRTSSLVADRLAARRHRRRARAEAEAGLAARTGRREPAPRPAGRCSRSRATPRRSAPSSPTMNRLFPDNDGMRAALVQLAPRHRRRRPTPRRVLRAPPPPADPRTRPAPALTLAQFLLEVQRRRRRPRRARAPAPPPPPTPPPFRRALAGLDFAEGRRRRGHRRACAALRRRRRAIGRHPRHSRSALAEMLAATGDAAGRATLLATRCSAADPTHVAGAEAPRPGWRSPPTGPTPRSRTCAPRWPRRRATRR